MTSVIDWSRYAAVAREIAAQGAVLLRNEGAALPILKGEKVALFGRTQSHYYKSGTGSGGMVNTRYVVSILDAFLKHEGVSLDRDVLNAYQAWEEENPIDLGKGWAQEPWSQVEMPLDKALVAKAAEATDIAVVVIGRSAGEDKDNKPEKGSYFLADGEEAMLEAVCAAFKRVAVVLNVGNIIDMGFVKRFAPQAVLYVWQGGQEGGNGAVDVLTGSVNPSGCLPDTIAQSVTDYPANENFGDADENVYKEDIFVGYRYFETLKKEKVLYPFGFGLSYTAFETKGIAFKHDEANVHIEVTVKNIGQAAGRHTVQLYAQAPQGALCKPARVLIAYGKTALLAPGASQSMTFSVPFSRFASYDDNGATGHAYCFLLEAGEYAFYVGDNVRDAVLAGKMELQSTKVLEKLSQALAPVKTFERMTLTGTEPAPVRQYDLNRRILEALPPNHACTGDKGIKLKDAMEGRASMDAFLSQLTDEELCCIVRGEGMSSPKVTPGTAAAYGGITKALLDYGIPIGCCTDGPSGLRLDDGAQAFSMPNGTCQAATFDVALVEALYDMTGRELKSNNVDLLLGPGMNIHRHPLNGRNFEYFSEDPFLTGTMAAAQLKGMNTHAVSGVIKHFACNNQEFRRSESNSVVSERALREIYLKGYEIAVKEGGAVAVMTSYGSLNGLWTAGSYDLNTTILRNEWGFKGIVMTDWWAAMNDEGGASSRENLAAMVRAQNDIYMVVGDSLKQNEKDNLLPALKDGRLTRGEILRCAENICLLLWHTCARERFLAAPKAVAVNTAMAHDGCLKTIILSTQQAKLPLETTHPQKGDQLICALAIEDLGEYEIKIRYRAKGDERAQIPVMVYMNEQLLLTLTLHGTQGHLQEESASLGYQITATKQLRLLFAADGLEVVGITVGMC